MQGEPSERDMWETVVLESISKDGFPRKIFHTHKGEIEDLKDEILERLDEIDVASSEYMLDEEEHREPEDPNSHDISMLPRDFTYKIVALFALSTGIMEEQTEMILQEKAIADEFKDTDLADEVLDQTFKTKLDWVNEIPEVKQSTYDDANDVRKTRNDLVHDPIERLVVPDLPNLKGSIKKAYRAPETLSQAHQSVKNQ